MNRLLLTSLLAPITPPCRPVTLMFFLAALICSGTSAASAEIEFENASSTNVKPPIANEMSWTHSVGSGNDRVLVVGVSFRRKDTQTVTQVSYGGTPLTFVGAAISTDRNTKYRAEAWVLVAPDVGTALVEVSFEGDDEIDSAVGGAATFTGVDPNMPFGAPASNGGDNESPSVDIPGSQGKLVFDVLAIKGKNSNVVTPGTGQFERWNDETGNDANDEVIGALSTRNGSANHTMHWNVESEEQWALCAVPLNPSVIAQLPTDLEVTKTVDNPTPFAGDTIVYTVRVTNLGPSDATGIEVLDVLPPGVTYDSHTPSQGTYDPGTGKWVVGSIDNGDDATLLIAVVVDET